MRTSQDDDSAGLIREYDALGRLVRGIDTRFGTGVGYAWDEAGRLTSLRYARPMPTVLRSGPYRVYFFSHEPNEPPHVHVDRDDMSAKFWLGPRNLGFAARELRRIEGLIRGNEARLIEAWHGYFGT